MSETLPASLPRCEVGDENTFVFVHDCLTYLGETTELSPDPASRRSLPLSSSGHSGWVWIGEPGRTIHPSIDCGRCGTHGFWIDGEWRAVG